jgi:hypothetical protein
MPEIKRDRWGRPMVPNPLPDGKPAPHQRPSSIASKIADTYALTLWKQRMTAIGVASRPDLVALAHALDPDDAGDKKQLDEVVKTAMEVAGSQRGANLGTAIHAYCRQVNAGTDPQVMDIHKPTIDAYRALLERHQIVPKILERFVVWSERQIAGSCDIYGEIDGRLAVIDIKTGQHNPAKFSMVEYSAQLACYANARHLWDGETAEALPEIDTEVGYLIWLPSGGDQAELIRVDITKGRRYVDLALEVADAHKDRSVGQIIAAPTPALPRPVADPISDGIARCYRTISELLEAGTTADDIKDCWPEDVPQLNAGVAAHTEQTIAAIEGALELARMGAKLVVASDDAVEAMIHRLRALPGDLYIAVEANAKALEPPLPNLRSGRATDADLGRLAEFVERAEHEHAERVMQLTNALSPLTADQAASIVDWATEQRMDVEAGAVPAIESLTDLEAERAVSLAEIYVDADGGLEALLAPWPKSAVLATAKDAAGRHGLPAPKSVAAVATDRVLAALTIHNMKEATA